MKETLNGSMEGRCFDPTELQRTRNLEYLVAFRETKFKYLLSSKTLKKNLGFEGCFGG